MVVGEPMVVELSVARTTPKWIVALPMPHVGWPNLWSKLDFAAGKETNKQNLTLKVALKKMPMQFSFPQTCEPEFEKVNLSD